MGIELENEHSDGWHELAYLSAGVRALMDVVKEHELCEEVEALTEQYMPEELEKFQNGLH